MSGYQRLKERLENVKNILKKIETDCLSTLKTMNIDSGTNAYAMGRCIEAEHILILIRDYNVSNNNQQSNS